MVASSDYKRDHKTSAKSFETLAARPGDLNLPLYN